MESVFVVATGRAATAQALRRAGKLARESGASIVLIVPHLTTFASYLERHDDLAVRLADEYRDLATGIGIKAFVRVCVCQRMKDIFVMLVGAVATIVIGGKRGSWFRPTAERRLADDLAKDGHRVVFEDLAAGADAAVARQG
jgi:K+-sensing histidine kinase KdpD